MASLLASRAKNPRGKEAFWAFGRTTPCPDAFVGYAKRIVIKGFLAIKRYFFSERLKEWIKQ